ncbi:TolC family protein [Marivivens aquimaris]|uniref:TolC family protein n=1 Tax=Marivivens aquimaris TaxID=2774876 RepID=UPI00187E89FA|nr:TolC family protein [Marivivens aquimaris]
MTGFKTAATLLVCVTCAISLSGCSWFGGQSGVPEGQPSQTAALSPEMIDGSQSRIITDLLNRRSVLPEGPLADIASAVLASNSRAAEAELRAAQLRAEAKSKNWLPSVGPQVSLSSLGDLVAGMVVEQVLFDNGRKRAERDYAQAEVEVAAVTLAEDTNERVADALDLYLTAEAKRARAEVSARAMERMEYFVYVMSERLRGGASNPADFQLVDNKLQEMRAELTADREAAAAALAQLNAMTDTPVDGIHGLTALSPPAANAVPLPVMRAEAEGNQAVASARYERAGYLPGLSASGGVSSDGDTEGGLNVLIPNGLGLGSSAAMQAIEAEEMAATARAQRINEELARRIAGLRVQLVTLQNRQTQAAQLAVQTARNYETFAEQRHAGMRTVMDVVNVFEAKVRTERQSVEVVYEIARVEIQIAALLGTLVDGESI